MTKNNLPFDSRTLKVGDTLITEGSQGTTIYWLQEGVLGVYKKTSRGLKNIGKIFSGELVGEMSGLDGESRCATVIALTECELIEIPAKKFQEIFNSQPQWYQSIIKTLLARLRRADLLLANSLKHIDDEEKVKDLLDSQEEIRPDESDK